MDPKLNQTQSQKMQLSPQMREYLRLLHLPIADLRLAVEEALEANPMLEEVSRSVEIEYPDVTASKPKDIEDDSGDGEALSGDWTDKEPLLFPKTPIDLSRRNADDLQKIKDFQETLITRPESLFDYLEWQLHFLDLDEKQKKIAEQIIGNIDQDGYLKVSLEEIASEAKSTIPEAQDILDKIQKLDPPGIGARDLREALLIQLQRHKTGTTLAKEIVQDHLGLIAKRDFRILSKIFNASEEEIKRAVSLISRLEPKPGRSFYVEEPIAVTPDATISIKDGTEEGLEIEIHNELIPEIRINHEYRSLMRDKNTDNKTKEFLRTRLASGVDFLKALELRKSTLRSITEEIVRAQPLFFTRGFSQLRPLRLKDIAERLGLHESTISRAIHAKYLKTPQGTIPYKSFFSQKIETEDGESESQKSILERIRMLLEKENAKKPWSDQAIVRLLKEEGIPIARRTVTKYRELLKIPPSHLRRN
ncbi:MAG TPA: RNA polymerase factor sigma-54 [Candidatus Omnitrophota bacterium]|nr:RNA polymerase factor sigma-54 [Candidatus Omnitrophota bacterium]